MTPEKRIKLINCDEEILISILKGNESLSENLKVNIPENWTGSGEVIFPICLEEIIKNPESKKWWTYLPILIEANTLIGSCGFKGEPIDGKVEIGYEVTELYRNNGYATEILNLLTELAFNNEKVKTIIGQTLNDNLSSIKVLEKCDFKFVRVFNDLEEGQISEYERKR